MTIREVSVIPSKAKLVKKPASITFFLVPCTIVRCTSSTSLQQLVQTFSAIYIDSTLSFSEGDLRISIWNCVPFRQYANCKAQDSQSIHPLNKRWLVTPDLRQKSPIIEATCLTFIPGNNLIPFSSKELRLFRSSPSQLNPLPTPPISQSLIFLLHSRPISVMC